jgi:hypothetical protein
MQIRSVRHRGLRRLLEKNDTKGIRPDQADRIRKILAVLIVAETMDPREGTARLARSPACRRPARNVEHLRFGKLAHHL